MPTLSASDYTNFIKLQAAAQSYRNGAIPTKIQTSDQVVPLQSILNAQLLASQASYVAASPDTVKTRLPNITEASSTTVTDAASRTITSVSSRTVTSAVANGTTVTYTTSVPHGLSAGDTVTISGLTNTSLNLSTQIVLASGLTSTQFVVSNAVAAASETGSTAGRINNRVYYTTSVEHGLIATQTITISNTSATFNLSNVTITTVTSPTQFVVTNSANTTNFTGSGATAGRVSRGVGLIFYTTSVPHALTVGQSITITDAGAFSVGPVTVAAVTTPTRFSVTSSADNSTVYSGTAAGITGYVYYTTETLHNLVANRLNSTYSITGLTTTTAYNLTGFTISSVTGPTRFVVTNNATGAAITGQSGFFEQTTILVPRTVISANARVRPYDGVGYVNQPKNLSTVAQSGTLSSGKTQQLGGLPLIAPKGSGVYSPIPQLARVNTRATGAYKSVRQPV
jgi:hypothetical protein